MTPKELAEIRVLVNRLKKIDDDNIKTILGIQSQKLLEHIDEQAAEIKQLQNRLGKEQVHTMQDRERQLQDEIKRLGEINESHRYNLRSNIGIFDRCYDEFHKSPIDSVGLNEYQDIPSGIERLSDAIQDLITGKTPDLLKLKYKPVCEQQAAYVARLEAAFLEAKKESLFSSHLADDILQCEKRAREALEKIRGGKE